PVSASNNSASFACSIERPSSPRQHRLQRRCRQQQLSSQQKRKLICSSDRDNQFSESWESLFQTRPAFFLLALRGRPLISCCSRDDTRRRQTLTSESQPVNGRELWRQRCGRFLKVKNRPRADPVGGLGGGDRDAMATLEGRCWAGMNRAFVLRYLMLTV